MLAQLSIPGRHTQLPSALVADTSSIQFDQVKESVLTEVRNLIQTRDVTIRADLGSPHWDFTTVKENLKNQDPR